MSSKSIYYVYAYLRSVDSTTAKIGTPYYIGKGKTNRAYRCHGKYIHVPKDKNFIVFIKKNLTEDAAFKLEEDLVELYGRKIDNSGILLNVKKGGFGGMGDLVQTNSGKIVSKEEFDMDYSLHGINHGKSIYTDGNVYKILSPKDKLVLSGEFKRTTEGKTQVLIDGKVKLVTQEYKEKYNLDSMNKGKVPVKDEHGNRSLVSIDNEDYKSGKLTPIVGSKTVLKHHISGKLITINRGDVIPDGYVGQNKGGVVNLITLSDGKDVYRIAKTDERIGYYLFPFKKNRKGEIILIKNHNDQREVS